MIDRVHDVLVRTATPTTPGTILAYLRARAMGGVEAVGEDSYKRVIHCPDGVPRIAHFSFAATTLSSAVRVTVSQPVETRVLHEAVNRLFGFEYDVKQAEAALARDATLGHIVAQQRGLRIPGTPDPFELAVRAILGQQVSVARAAHVASVLSQTLGETVPVPALGLTHAFPRPEALADADLAPFGLPLIRQRAISTLAARILEGDLFLDGTKSLADTTHALLAVPGIGPWTCAYIALRALGDLDSIPLEDLGLRTAVSEGGVPVSSRQLARRAEAWRPWRGLAAVHLWTTLLPEFRSASSG